MGGDNVHYKIATIVVNYDSAPHATTACLDTACDTTVVSEDYLKEFVPRAEIEHIPPLSVRGVGGMVTTVRRATFVAWAEDGTSDPGAVGIPILAYVLTKVPGHLLIGMDIMGPLGIKIDAESHEVSFSDARDQPIPLQITTKPHYFKNRSIRTTQQTVVPSHSAATLPVAVKGKTPYALQRDCLFEPSSTACISVYTALARPDMDLALVVNETDKPIVVPSRHRLGTLSDMEPHYMKEAEPQAACLALMRPTAQDRGFSVYTEETGPDGAR